MSSGAVVHSQVGRGAASGDAGLDDRDSILGGAGASDAHGECFPGVLVDDVAQLEAPPIRGLVELEVDGPQVVRALGAQQRPHRRVTGSAYACVALGGAVPRHATAAGCASC